MLPAYHDALRAALTTKFNAISYGATMAAQISFVCEELSNATKNILCDLASEWTCAHSIIHRLPVEVLAMCFTPLGLRDAMAVSHVSRSWRAVALSHPALWTRIDLAKLSGDIPRLINMALSRTGQHAVDFFEHFNLAASAVGPVVSCLATHMSHLRIISWHTQALNLPFSYSAPLLEEFRAPSCNLVVSPDFLGGQVGRLRTLQLSTICFPQTCPALSTLSHLFLEFLNASAMTPEGASSLKRMFELCPRLQSLSLLYMTLKSSRFLPAVPAPRTLTKLDLSTMDPHYDLIRHYVDWKCGDNLNDVRLEMDESCLPECRFRDFVDGSTRIVVMRDGTETTIEATGPGMSRRSITFDYSDEPEDDYCDIAALLLSAQSSLRLVQSLGIPLFAVDDFISEDVFTHALPKLAMLTVLFDEPPSYTSGWDSVPVILRRAVDVCVPLRGIRLDFRSWEDDQPLTADVARELLGAFERSAPTLQDVRIIGFEPDAVRELRIPKIDGCHIRFDAGPEDTETETETDSIEVGRVVS